MTLQAAPKTNGLSGVTNESVKKPVISSIFNSSGNSNAIRVNLSCNLPGMMSQQNTGSVRYCCDASKLLYPQASECPGTWTTVAAKP